MGCLHRQFNKISGRACDKIMPFVSASALLSGYHYTLCVQGFMLTAIRVPV